MSISETRDRLEHGLLEFAWNEWAQLGVLARPSRVSPWAQDLEALVVLSLEVARTDPRLFDEILDWLAHNEELLSVRRLRTLARRSREPTVVGAVLAWLAQHRPKARFSGPHDPAPAGNPRRLFFDDRFPIRTPDEAFLRHGWLRPAVDPSGKAGTPDLRSPIAFGLRLRRLLGPGARAESVRVLLSTDAPRTTASVIASSAGYTKRNVLEALRELEDAGAVSSVSTGYEARYGISRERWAALLEERLPFPPHVEWIQLLGTLATLLGWLRIGMAPDASDYLVGSAARGLLAEVRPDLEWAGIPVDAGVLAGGAVQELGRVVDRCLGALGVS